ncbi:hypothetical protein Nepgr_029501 [Nepenthes gracilis]|uniref:PB1 domain-containing protein n=1 Tax=Nepenthes gracilis TaxID=150966 RepID=A0AAD3Y3B4_NEPGR|nr:hypothetical protein Nepgr_029501 [Nepenthes gracilis]
MVGPPVEPATATIKFLCSYGGKIVPRYPDGKLRYVGGHTRVLAVDRSISFPELLLKLEALCGKSVSLRCQLPTEDLDALVSIKSDEDLINLIEEYNCVGPSFPSLKIRAFLSVPRSTAKKVSPPLSDAGYSPKSLSPTSFSPSSFWTAGTTSRFSNPVAVHRHVHQAPMAPVVASPICCEKSASKVTYYYGHHHGHGSPGRVYLNHRAITGNSQRIK